MATPNPDEIEITPGMVEAALAALNQWADEGTLDCVGVRLGLPGALQAALAASSEGKEKSRQLL